jgi:hypothetical protein
MIYASTAIVLCVVLCVNGALSHTENAGAASQVTDSHRSLTRSNTKTSPRTLTNTGAYTIQSNSVPPDPINMSLQFQDAAALNYYLSLNTSTKLLSDTRGDNTIYLSDDQPLDYNALMDIHSSTGNATALALATQINNTMTSNYGSLYRFWNGVFVVFGDYPSAESWNITGGVNQALPSDDSYKVFSTVFPVDTNSPVELRQYADIALYYAIWNAEAAGGGGSLATADKVFLSSQSFCSNYGCKDASNVGQATAYQSFKLALDLIAYKILLETGAFNSVSSLTMTQVNATIDHMIAIANQLQASNGGVYTQYNVEDGIIVPVGSGIALAENGETTSLFAIASYLWNGN